MSKKDDFQTFGSAFQQFLQKSGMKDRFDEKQILASWERLVGKPIAKKTRRMWIKNNILFVEFDSATIKSDFSFHKTQVLSVFSKEFGPNAIKDIFIL